MAELVTAEDLALLRRAIALAAEARAGGADPFGAVLARKGRVAQEGGDRSVRAADPTAHAELDVIRGYCRRTGQLELRGYTLSTSTEPCLMCAGAIH